jgi:hypothetical protein
MGHMGLIPGDRVRLTKPAPVSNAPGPPVGTIGTVIALQSPAARPHPSLWRVEFDDFPGQFHFTFKPGTWVVDSDEVELLTVE